VDEAAAGDFGTYRQRDSARVAFTISAFADATTSPLDPAIFRQPYADQAAALYRALLPRLPELLDDVQRFRTHWQAEDDVLEASVEAIATGAIRIEERPELDLAVVTVPEAWPGRHVHRFTQARHTSCHPMAIHNATGCFRILLVQGRRYEVQYRYESWVQYVSRRPAPRVDLAPLALRLTAEEGGGGRWTFDGADEITPRLRLEGEGASRIEPDRFRAEVEAVLASAPPAWDPYDPVSAL
jgi:hypothetical protein